ncbi:MAG: 2-oxo acid dehydrogenase subunit E2 [Actinobacteria bacterium]|nr:2-oxo acid dehydrogenase subunit E2 [Actinomycetota bacterium]
MPDYKQFKLPDIGEGLTEADIVKWTVQPGDTVTVNQNLIEIETAKAVVELPSPWAGVVHELLVSEGETVDVGRPIITIDVDPGGSAPAGSVSPGAGVEAPNAHMPNGDVPKADANGRQAVLVGYGPRAEGGARRRRRSPAAEPAAQDRVPDDRVPDDRVPEPTVNSAFQVPPRGADLDEPASQHRVLAKPPVRKLAKNLGVDLTTVAPSGPEGAITREDVQAAAEDSSSTGSVRRGSSSPPRVKSVRAGGRETRVPVRGVRKHTAAAMVSSAFTAPHVTEFMSVDVTATMQLRDRVAARPEFRGVRVSPLVFVARALILAARRTPEINATWDDAAGEIVLKHYVNLGIAAATDRGLIVPNVKDADQLSLLDLAHAINDLAQTARAGRTAPADLTGGTITITNVGVFGVDTGTPILNPGETGILAFGAVRRMPWVVTDGDTERIEPRSVTQLAVSFDHRVVDGQQGSHFLADVGGLLADPGLALL